MGVDLVGLRARVTEYASDLAVLATDACLLQVERDTNVGETGVLRNSYQVEGPKVAGPQVTMRISNPTPYASFVDKGTRPHEIRGNPLLVFFWAKVGRVVAFPRVNHPGNIAYDFFELNLGDLWPQDLDEYKSVAR